MTPLSDTRKRKTAFDSDEESDGDISSGSDTEQRRNKKKATNTQLTKHEIKWQEMFLRLVQYKVKTGNCLVPQNHKDDPKVR